MAQFSEAVQGVMAIDGKVLRRVLAVYIAALVAFAFFRSSWTPAALDLLAGTIGLHGLGPALPRNTVAAIVALFGIVWACPNLQQIMTNFEPVLGRPILNPYPRFTWQPDTLWAVLCGIVVALGVLTLGGTTEFLYSNFELWPTAALDARRSVGAVLCCSLINASKGGTLKAQLNLYLYLHACRANRCCAN
jgi:hypothetical protein